jgi:DMSO/TMAO reductase YedYZ heme-binding membrane subunit
MAILVVTFLLSAVLIATSSHESPDFRDTQCFAAIAALCLYTTLLVGPLYALFPGLRFRSAALAARRALGISTFWFAALHAYFGFFRFIGGFEGLAYWSGYFRRSLACGLVALVILGILTAASLPPAAARLGRGWKPMQRSLYAAAILTLAHAVTVTVHVPHFTGLLIGAYPLLVLLAGLELVRLDRHAGGHHRVMTAIGLPSVAAALFWAFFFLDHHTH